MRVQHWGVCKEGIGEHSKQGPKASFNLFNFECAKQIENAQLVELLSSKLNKGGDVCLAPAKFLDGQEGQEAFVVGPWAEESAVKGAVALKNQLQSKVLCLPAFLGFQSAEVTYFWKAIGVEGHGDQLLLLQKPELPWGKRWVRLIWPFQWSISLQGYSASSACMCLDCSRACLCWEVRDDVVCSQLLICEGDLG